MIYAISSIKFPTGSKSLSACTEMLGIFSVFVKLKSYYKFNLINNVRIVFCFFYQNGSDSAGTDHVGFNGDIPGAAHYTAADQTETELVLDIHADLAGRRAHRAVHNLFVRS